MFVFVMPSGRQKTLKIREDWKSSNRLCDGDDEEIKTKNTRTHTHNFDRGRRGEERWKISIIMTRSKTWLMQELAN